jgi:hypothetical protein
MKITAYITVIFFVTIILSCVGDLGSFSETTNSKNIENINQGNITLFSQNYSEINNIPSNIFIVPIQNTTNFDSIYSTIYGIHKSEILFDNTSKELRYTTTRNSLLIPHSLLSYVDNISCCEIIQWVEQLIKPSYIVTFCKFSSIPIIDYLEEPTQSGSLYVCDLTPMVKCAYEISMDINTDDPQSFVEFDSAGSKLIVREIDNNTVLKSYFQTDSGDMGCKSISIGNDTEKSYFKIIFDGENKTNTICAKNGSYIVTPFYNLERQKLPYVDFSNGHIKFTSFILGEGTYIGVNISSVNQKADRKFITPIGNSKMVAFGLDGPHPRNTIEQGINYLNSKDDSGTLWFDMGFLKNCNETDLEYLRNLVNNDSWEAGIHFSKELNSLPIEETYKTMDEESEYVYEKIGKKPTSWCSLRNSDNITHAIYAYKKWGMYWRNGDSGVYAEKIVGNLYDNTWVWWEQASRAGMSHPVYTHQLDKDPAIKYSISYPKFKTWVDNYCLNNVSIVSFYEYGQINRNTYDAYFDNISSNGNLIKFNAHTNGIRSLINVNITAGNDIQVYDCTFSKFLKFALEQDKSITFWAENNHTYNLLSAG